MGGIGAMRMIYFALICDHFAHFPPPHLITQILLCLTTTPSFSPWLHSPVLANDSNKRPRHRHPPLSSLLSMISITLQGIQPSISAQFQPNVSGCESLSLSSFPSLTHLTGRQRLPMPCSRTSGRQQSVALAELHLMTCPTTSIPLLPHRLYTLS